MSTASDLNRFDASMSDGRTAVATQVQVRLGETGLEISVPGERRAALVWPYQELRSGVPLRAAATDVLLSRSPAGTETLFLVDPDFSNLLLQRAKALGAGRWRLAALRPGIAAVVIVALVVGLARLLSFHPSQTVAKLLPDQTRDALGRSVVAQLTGSMRKCETGPGRDALDKLTRRLTAVAAPSSTPVRVILVDWALVNAFAAPGGYIIMTRGLVQRAASADEVAGVLAHEIGHTLELHPEAGLVRALGLTAAAQLVFAGSSGTVANIGILLTQMRYTRVAEREADAHALQMLKGSGISAKGFGDFFERLEPRPANPTEAEKKAQDAKTEEAKKGTGLAKRIFESELLRTHPPTKARLETVRAQPTYPSTPALDAAEWRALQTICGTTTIAPPPRRQDDTFQRPVPSPRPPLPAPAPPKAEPYDADRVIAEASKVLETRPADVDALQRRALAYNRKGRQSEALVDLTKALEIRPTDPSLHSARGGVHYGARQFELAIAAYSEAIRLDPNHALARNGRGNTYRALKQYDAAVADFDALIATRPAYIFSYYNRALTYADMGRRDEAIRDLTTAIGKDRDYAAAYTQRGLLHQVNGARELAIADFRTALASPLDKYESGAWAHRTARERLRALGIEVP